MVTLKVAPRLLEGFHGDVLRVDAIPADGAPAGEAPS
jgi:hypothetical protein